MYFSSFHSKTRFFVINMILQKKLYSIIVLFIVIIVISLFPHILTRTELCTVAYGKLKNGLCFIIIWYLQFVIHSVHILFVRSDSEITRFLCSNV